MYGVWGPANLGQERDTITVTITHEHKYTPRSAPLEALVFRDSHFQEAAKGIGNALHARASLTQTDTSTAAARKIGYDVCLGGSHVMSVD